MVLLSAFSLIAFFWLHFRLCTFSLFYPLRGPKEVEIITTTKKKSPCSSAKLRIQLSWLCGDTLFGSHCCLGIIFLPVKHCLINPVSMLVSRLYFFGFFFCCCFRSLSRNISLKAQSVFLHLLQFSPFHRGENNRILLLFGVCAFCVSVTSY